MKVLMMSSIMKLKKLEHICKFSWICDLKFFLSLIIYLCLSLKVIFSYSQNLRFPTIHNKICMSPVLNFPLNGILIFMSFAFQFKKVMQNAKLIVNLTDAITKWFRIDDFFKVSASYQCWKFKTIIIALL